MGVLQERRKLFIYPSLDQPAHHEPVFARPLLTAGVLAFSAPLWAGAETVLGVSNAQRRFEGALAGQSTLSTIELCSKALNMENLSEKDRAATFTNRGILYGQSGRADRALGDFGRALELSPGLIHTLINRGNLFVRLKRFTEAMADYDQALLLRRAERFGVLPIAPLPRNSLGGKQPGRISSRPCSWNRKTSDSGKPSPRLSNAAPLGFGPGPILREVHAGPPVMEGRPEVRERAQEERPAQGFVAIIRR